MNFFDLHDIDLGSTNLQTIEVLSHATSHNNLVILTFIGADLAGRGAYSATSLSRARNSGHHSRARVNIRGNRECKTGRPPQVVVACRETRRSTLVHHVTRQALGVGATHKVLGA